MTTRSEKLIPQRGIKPRGTTARRMQEYLESLDALSASIAIALSAESVNLTKITEWCFSPIESDSSGCDLFFRSGIMELKKSLLFTEKDVLVHAKDISTQEIANSPTFPHHLSSLSGNLATIDIAKNFATASDQLSIATFHAKLVETMMMFEQAQRSATDLASIAKMFSEKDTRFASLAEPLAALMRSETKDTEVGDSTSSAPQSDPLAAARARGNQYVQAEWNKPENLPLEAASDISGRSDRVLNEHRQKGFVYALLLTGRARGFRYPSWQFEADPGRLTAAIKPFFDAKVSSWTVHSFMMRHHEALKKMRGCDYVLDTSLPIDRLVDEAKRSLPGDQGAL